MMTAVTGRLRPPSLPGDCRATTQSTLRNPNPLLPPYGLPFNHQPRESKRALAHCGEGSTRGQGDDDPYHLPLDFSCTNWSRNDTPNADCNDNDGRHVHKNTKREGPEYILSRVNPTRLSSNSSLVNPTRTRCLIDPSVRPLIRAPRRSRRVGVEKAVSNERETSSGRVGRAGPRRDENGLPGVLLLLYKGWRARGTRRAGK